MTDTIFALSTPPGRSGVAVIRLSGAGSGAIVDALAGEPRPRPREAALRRLRDRQNATLDRALVLWFPGPASFTGEDCAEFHVHGGEAVIEGVFEALRAEGARPAQGGEFTRRAFENGKLDLTEAEGLADLIEAETEGQREQALAQMGGALKTLYEGWREDLIAILSAIEGEIDFPDEDDVPGSLAATAGPGVEALIAALETHLDDDRRGEIVRRGFTIAIIGAPNAGKSSILNRLARREAAIVTDIPGTTRDVVEVRLVLAGFPVILADTAGLREASDRVEAEGVRRALERARDADLRLGVIDGTDKDARPPEALREGDILIANKSDLGVGGPSGAITVSATTGAGFDTLETELSARVSARLSRREAPALSRARHREAVETALSALRRGRARLIDAPELAGEDVRLAFRALVSLTGGIDVVDVLDRVFSQFCIG